MFLYTILLIVLQCNSIFANIDYIECPIPGGVHDQIPEEECNSYTACLYNFGRCRMKDNEEAGYQVVSGTTDTGRGFKVDLRKSNMNNTLFGDDIENLVLEVIYHEEYHVQIKISNQENNRYEVPIPLNLPSNGVTSDKYFIHVNEEGSPFRIEINRTSTGTEMFRTIGPLTYEDQFIQFSVRLPSDYLYGFGENYHRTLRHQFNTRTTYPIFSTDRPTVNADQYCHYGAHPYYMNVEDDAGNAHSVLFMNSNAVEYSTFLIENNVPALTLRSLGGIIDLHLFIGPTPEEVSKQYIQTIGTPFLPPYWSLGFTLSRFDYGSSLAFREVWDRMKENAIPQDVQIFDIDYMDGRKDFTYDPVNWPDLPELVDSLHEMDMRVVLILDPAIAIDWNTYPPSERGREQDVYMKWMSADLIPDNQINGTGDYIVGRVWPQSQTVFPDFMKPSATQWWSQEIQLFHEEVDFDSLWIDMNEPSNFATNLEGDNNLQCPNTPWDDPPYPSKVAFSDVNFTGRISDKTLCMSSNHTDGTIQYLHYDVHNVYGYFHSKSTASSLTDLFPGKRQAILSRSTFVGSGKYAIHWLGDNGSTWDQMELSIIGMIEFSLFGIPMTGADICGFFFDATVELCARWMQLGAFYPYSRNHNSDQSAPQDPAFWPEVAEVSRNVLAIRYKFLPYLYTLLYEAHLSGSTVLRGLFMEFPRDLICRNISDQFLWGNGLMIAPVIVEGAIEREVYFPEGNWYELESGALYSEGIEYLTVDAPLNKIPLYARGGVVLPYQEPGLNTVISRQNPFGFLVCLDANFEAEGQVFWDDGETLPTSEGAFTLYSNFHDKIFSTTVLNSPDLGEDVTIGSVVILGYTNTPFSVLVDGVEILLSDWNYENDKNILRVNISIALNQAFNLEII